MSLFWKTWWGFGFMVTPLIVGLLGVAIDIHIARSRHFAVMLDSLQRSQGLQRWLSIWGSTDTLYRTLVVSSVSGGLLFPKYSIKKGLLDAKDIERFPTYLKRRMNIASCLAFIGFTCGTLVALLLKITK